MMNLLLFLSDEEQGTDLPWKAMEYVVGQINYGGRITDENDRRCLTSIMRLYITPRILDDAYTFTPSGTYASPFAGSLESYRCAV